MALFACAIAGALAFPAASRAQDQPPPSAIGKITGPDLTVESGAAAGNGLPSSAPSIFVLRGSSITVHSGQAQMTLFSGGTLDICGPAKFTVLESAGSVTVALNFGKIRVQLPAERALKIYTPTIIATPLEIGGGLRDVTVGLDLQDSLCVHPSTGALQLESQFTGEKIIVPENSEFFLAAGKLAPVPGTPGSCQCDSSPLAAAQEPPAPAPVPPAIAIVNSKPIPLPPPHPGETPPPASEVAPPDAGAPAVTFVVPVETPAPPKPAAPTPAAPSSPPPAATPSPVVHVSTPALSFSAPSGLAPTQPSVETLVLVTQARVEPEYEFRGQVSPEFVSAMQSALGEAPGAAAAAPKPPKPSHAGQPGPAPGSANAPASAPSSPSSAAGTPAAQPKPKKKGGFWSSLKKVFVGSSD